MSLLDWGVFFAFLAWVVIDGLRRARKNQTAEDLFLASRHAPWWAMGLSIMATQASAITMTGTTGQGWEDGLRFAQYYYALPLAMVILAFTLLPLYHRHQVFTAYEYLGLRFDLKTRLLSAAVFLVLRGLSVGFVIYAPSVILSAVLELPTSVTIVGMGAIAVAYTSFGGMRAVLSTDVKQMSVMIVGIVVALLLAIRALPEDIGFSGALRLADATDRLVLADWSFDPTEKYSIWSALLGGTLLFLSYFGCDQSQAQRFLSGRSLGHERGALLLNALAKVPFQIVVLLVGTMLFALYTFEAPPPSFVPVQAEAAAEAKTVVATAEAEWTAARDAARALVAAPEADADAARAFREAVDRADASRADAIAELQRLSGDENTETNYVFPYFVLNTLPVGLVGLLIAAIFAAALSSIDSELNAMATVAVMDLHPRGRRRTLGPAGERRASKIAMAVIGTLATVFALYVVGVGSLIEAVNEVGSWFYGALLGVFILAVGTRRAEGTGAVVGIVAGILAVVVADRAWTAEDGSSLPFLYRNTVGTLATVIIGWCVSWGVTRSSAARA